MLNTGPSSRGYAARLSEKTQRTRQRPPSCFLPIRDNIRIDVQAPVLYYRNDEATLSQCTAMSIHRLYIDQEEIAEWIRQSIGGYGLDLNHPGTWAAVAIDPALSRYEIVVKPMLRILGIEDHAPVIQEPKRL